MTFPVHVATFVCPGIYFRPDLGRIPFKTFQEEEYLE